MLEKALERNATMEGRSVGMKVIATGDIQDAYDIYVDVIAYSDALHAELGRMELRLEMFLRLIYWKTTHKKLVIGTVSILNVEGDPVYIDGVSFAKSSIGEAIERISTPVEIKDYWKKSFEKYVVCHISDILKDETNINTLGSIWRFRKTKETGKDCTVDPAFNHVLVYTTPIASWELGRRNRCCASGDESKGLDHKCFDGPHGFVRSDKADDFDIPPVTSFPVTELVV